MILIILISYHFLRSHSSNAVYFVEQDPVYRKHCNKGQRPFFPYKNEEQEVVVTSNVVPSVVSR